VKANCLEASQTQVAADMILGSITHDDNIGNLC